MMVNVDPPPEIHYHVPSMRMVKFTSSDDAKLFQSKKGGMIVKEQGQNIWYVMPEFNGTRQLSYMEES